MQRRHFIQLSLLGVAAACSWSSYGRSPEQSPLRFLSSVNDALGEHFIVAANAAGEELFRISVAERCHSGCLHPSTGHAVIMSRRPGINLYVINMLDGTLETLIEAGEDFHFYGHGCSARMARASTPPPTTTPVARGISASTPPMTVTGTSRTSPSPAWTRTNCACTRMANTWSSPWAVSRPTPIMAGSS